MFEEVLGLPLHPLAVHVPIVLVPLLVLASLAYALLPRHRGRVAWVAVILAVVAPVSALVAKLAGDAFGERLYGTQLPEPVVDHSNYGNWLMWSSIALGVLTLALVATRRRAAGSAAAAGERWAAAVLTVLLVAAAGASSWFLFQVGHSGAENVWQGM